MLPEATRLEVFALSVFRSAYCVRLPVYVRSRITNQDSQIQKLTNSGQGFLHCLVQVVIHNDRIAGVGLFHFLLYPVESVPERFSDRKSVV